MQLSSLSSAGKHCKAHLVQVDRIGNPIDGDDLAISYRETHKERQMPMWGHNKSHCPVHEHRLNKPGPARPSDDLLSDRNRPADGTVGLVVAPHGHLALLVG